MTVETFFAEIEEKARTLPPAERARLALALLESLEEPADPDLLRAWRSEIEDRLAAYDHGELEPIPAEEVFAEARRLAR
jgi:putative addiction module component (TIGR02574 family)